MSESSVLDAPAHEAAARPALRRAVLNYTHSVGERLHSYTYEPPPGVPRTNAAIDARAVDLHDGRADAGLGLDRSGFELVAHRSALRDAQAYRDAERVAAIYYPEVEAAVRLHTGAQKVLVFDHTLRDSTAGPGRAALREPVYRVHDDQTFTSAPHRVRRHLSPDEADARLQRRFAIVNFWRPIGDAVLRDPLALCDARSIDDADLLPSDLIYPDWVGETYAFAYNPRHRWYWFPRQTAEEASLLKVYDSATDGTARLTAHTAFKDPETPPDAPPRRSIEVRTLVFW